MSMMKRMARMMIRTKMVMRMMKRTKTRMRQ